MLAKRLAVIVLLVEGESSHSIASMLNVSSSTVHSLQVKYKKNEFSQLVGILKKDSVGYIKILQTIDEILTAGGALPHYNDKNRWKNLPR